MRLALIYLACLGALYVGFLLLERSSPGGAGNPQDNGLYAFTLLAAVLAAGGATISLHPAPRSIETTPTATVVTGRWGRRHVYPPPGQLGIREIRRYPAGVLSSSPLRLVELSGGPSAPATFLLEDDLVRSEAPPPRAEA